MDGTLAADLLVRIRGDASGAKAALEDTQKRFSSFADGIKSVGSGIANTFSTAVGFALGQVISRVASGVGQLIQTGLDFGKNMANVNSIAQLTTKQFRDLNQAVIDLASDPRILDSPAQLAAGLYDIVSSGFDATDALVVLKAAAIAGTAGLTDTATSVDALTTVLNAYGLSADHATEVSNTLFQIVNLGKLTYGELAGSIGNVIPTAAALGVNMNELGAAIAELTLKGVDASTASTYLNGVLTAFLKPTADLTAGLQAHGYATGQDAIQQLGFAGAMKLLNQIVQEGTGNVTDYVADSRAFRAVLALLSGDMKEYTKLVGQMNEAQDGAGATSKALAEQMKSASFQIAKAKQEVEILATVLVGAFAPAIGLVASLMTAILSKTLVPLAEGFARFTFLMGRAFDEGPKVKTLIAGLPEPVRLLGAAFFEAADILGDLGRALGEAWDKGKRVQDLVQQFPQPLRKAASGVLEIADAFGRLTRAFESGGLSAVFRQLPNALGDILTGVTNAVAGVVTAPVQIGIDIKDWFVNSVIEPLKDWLAETFAGAKGPSLLASLTGAPVGWNHVPIDQLLLDIGGWGLGIVKVALGDWLQSTFGGGTGGDPTLKGLPVGHTVVLGDVTAEIAGWLPKLADGAKSLAQAVYDFATGAARLGKQEIPTLYGYAVNIGSWLVNEAGTLTGNLASNVQGKVTSLWDAIKGVGSTLYGYTISVGSWAWGGVSEAAGSVWNFVKSHLGIGGSSAISNAPGGPQFGAGTAGVTLEGVALNILSWTKGQIVSAYADVKTWAGEALNAKGIDLTLSNWQLHLGKPLSGSGLGINVAAIIRDAFTLAPADIPNEITLPEGSAAKANELGRKLGQLVADTIIGGIKSVFHGSDTQSSSGDTLASVIQSFAAGAFAGLYDAIGNAVSPHLPDWLTGTWDWLTGPIGAGFEGVYNFIHAHTPAWLVALAKGDVIGAINAIFSGGGGAAGKAPIGFSGAIAGIGQKLGDLTTPTFGNLADAEAYANQQAGGSGGTTAGGGVFGVTPKAQMRAEYEKLLQASLATIPVIGSNFGAAAQPQKLAIDTGPAAAGIGILKTAIGQMQQQAAKHTAVSLDTGKAVTGFANALKLGANWSKATFTAHLDGDNRLFVAGLDDALKLGAVFDQLTFTAHLDAGIGGFVAGIDQALALGAAFSQATFTAKATIDTSGAQNLPTPNIPGHAGGGTITTPWAWVGEEGRELVHLPYGTEVYSASRSAAMLAGRPYGGDGAQDRGETHIHLGGVTVRVAGDVNNVPDLEDRMTRVVVDRIVPQLVKAVRP